MAFKELLQVGNSYNKPVKAFWCDSVAEIDNLPTNVPAGSYCECQIAPTTAGEKSTLKIYMLHKTSDEADNGNWYEI